MSDMSITQIIARLATVGVNAWQSATHYLQLEYPVAELLPDTIDTPYLTEPLELTYRSQPWEARTILGLAPPTFFVELRKTEVSDAQMSPEQRASEQAIQLIRAIAERAHASGSSTLQVVSFFDDLDADLFYRFRLTTTSLATILDFELTSSDMHALFSHTETAAWIVMLEDLINRASDRAYYHVHDQLAEYFDQDILDQDEEQWEDEWNTSARATAQELYSRRVSPRLVTESGSKDLVDLRLPCQHVKRVALQALQNLTAGYCLRDRCVTCNRPVLSEEDRTEHKLAQQTSEADDSVRRNRDWIRLDHSPSIDSMKVHTASLSKVLVEALASFEAPSILCQPSLQLPSLSNVQQVLANYTARFSESDFYITQSPGQLVALLLQLALDTPIDNRPTFLYQTSLQPGLVEGLIAWLTRTVNFLAKRVCRKNETGHLGFHHHGDRLMYNSCLWEEGETEEEPLKDDYEDGADAMEGLEAAMTDTNLVGATAQTLCTQLEAMDLDRYAGLVDRDGNVRDCVERNVGIM